MKPEANVYIEACEKAVDALKESLNEKEYVNSVNTMSGSDSETVCSVLYKLMEDIRADKNLSYSEKNECLKPILEQIEAIKDREIERKRQYAEIIDTGIRRKGGVFLRVVMAVLTGGISLPVEAGYNYLTNSHRKKARIYDDLQISDDSEDDIG